MRSKTTIAKIQLTMWTSFIMLMGIFAFSSAHAQQREIPELWSHVRDDAKALSPSAEEEIEQMLKVHEDSTSNQIVVFIIPSLDGEVLEEYSLRAAEKWKIGQKNKDNGALLLIAVNDHKMRIEVGSGLEGVLTDAICSRIIRTEIAPRFRQDDYDGGVKAGVEAMIKAIGGEYKADDNAKNDFQLEQMSIGERLIFGLIIFGVLGLFTMSAAFSSSGCASWITYIFLIPFYAIFPGAVIGMKAGLGLAVLYIIGFPILKIFARRTTWGQRMIKSMTNLKGSSGRGWSSGSGWFGGGGGSSGGGFSGGGGGFSGGGSSGSW